MSKKSDIFKTLPSWLYWTLFSLIIIVFIALRYIPISQETVPYTYDQGRDFFAARNIVVNKDIVLIGPTTGAQGVFHGAWWYYFLALPFLLFGGSPIGFYYFIALAGLVQGVVMAGYLKKYISPYVSLLFLALVSVSPYFIKTSVFAINSILTLPFILILLTSLYAYFKDKDLKYLFLMALSAGMIAEAEVAFGIFLFPSLLVGAFVSKNGKLFFGSMRKIVTIVGGVAFAMMLRILFELKNNFLQTKALTNFWGAENTQPKQFIHVIKDRFELFQAYYLEIFPKELMLVGVVLFIAAVIGYWKGYRKLEEFQKKWVSFVALLTILLFIISLVYKNSFFWAYYFEGIHFIFIALIAVGMYCLYSVYPRVSSGIILGVVSVMMVFGAMRAQSEYGKKIDVMGLKMHVDAIDYLYGKVGTGPFCLRMYTPPVLTHTYNYLLDQQSRTGKGTYPRSEYMNNECWYFIESDSFAQRRTDWILNNIPEGAEKAEDHQISKDLIIQKWVMKAAPDDSAK